mgnify:FL=1
MGTSRYPHNADPLARFGADMSSVGASSYDGVVGAQRAQVRLLEDGTLVRVSTGQVGGPEPGAYPTAAVRKRRPYGMIIAFTVVIALIGVGVAGLVVARSMRTPEAQVRRYLGLLSSGQASAASRMVDPGIPSEQRVFLTDEVLGATPNRLIVKEIVDMDEDSSSSLHQVRATMSVRGESFSQTFRVMKREPTLGFFDNWEVLDPLITRIYVTGRNVEGMTVDNVQATAPLTTDDTRRWALLAFYPGTYNLEPELSSKYVTADSVEVVAKGNDGRPADSDVMDVVVSTEYTQDIREAALAAIKEKTHACVTPAGNLDRGCPVPLQSRNLAVLEVQREPVSVESVDYEPNKFKSDLSFLIRPNTSGGVLRSVPSVAVASLRLDESASLILDADGKPTFDVSIESTSVPGC